MDLNKNKNILWQYFDGAETKFVYYKARRNPLSEGSSADRGRSEAQSVLNEFYEGRNPEEERAGDPIERTVAGVREEMGGPLGQLNVLSTKILDQKIRSRTEQEAQAAPNIHKETISHLADLEGGPGTETYRTSARAKLEAKIAKRLFTMRPGQKYDALLNELKVKLQRIGQISIAPKNKGAAAISINLANPNEETTVRVAAGSGQSKQITIKWHEQDFPTIKNILQQAKLWADFSKQPKAGKFIELKLKESWFKGIVAEEKAKLNVNYLDPQLLQWQLDRDYDEQILNSGNIEAGEDVTEQLEKEKNEGNRQEGALQTQLDKILGVNALENLATSIETKTLLEYIFRNKNLERVKEVIQRYYVKAKDAGEEYEGIASRTLLYELIKQDVRDKGATERTGLDAKALFTLNKMLIESRNQEGYEACNDHQKKALKKGGFKRRIEGIKSKLAFTYDFEEKIVSGATLVEHLADTNPGFEALKDIGLFATRKDLIEHLNRAGLHSPEKLREFSAMISESLKGLVMEPKTPGMYKRFKDKVLGRKQPALAVRVTVRDEDVLPLENLIRNLELLEAEKETEDVMTKVKAMSKNRDRAETMHSLLKERAQASKLLDQDLQKKLQGHGAEFKKWFMRSHISQEHHEAIDDLKANYPKEEWDEEFNKRRLPERVRKRGAISIRAAHALKEGGKKFIKYGPLGLMFYWAPKGLARVAKWSSEKTSKYVKEKWWDENEEGGKVVIGMFEGVIRRPIVNTFGFLSGGTAWILSRPKEWSDSALAKFRGRISPKK